MTEQSVSIQPMNVVPDLVTITATYDDNKSPVCQAIDVRLNLDRLTFEDIAALIRLLYAPVPPMPAATTTGNRSWAF